MSFSPLDGLTMGTRCGRLDAAVVLHLQQQEGFSAEQVSRLLHKGSGLLGLSGLSSDMRELEAAAAAGHAGAQRALDHFVEQILRELAALAAALRGLDALVFTGGIGENAAALRERIVEGAGWLGLRLDTNANRSAPGLVTTANSAVTALVLRTGEEAVIAQHTARLTGVA
jgi:acetate kinase